MTRRLLYLSLLLMLMPTNVFAKEKALGAFGSWQTYAYDQGGQTVCYMVTSKIVKSTGPSKRSAPYLMITHRPVEGSTDVISYSAGALLNAKRDVVVSMGKASFSLFAVHENAWARDAGTDHKIAAAVRENTQAQLKAHLSKHGEKPFTDIFDLSGSANAYHAISKACGLVSDKPLVAKKPAKKASSTKTKKHT